MRPSKDQMFFGDDDPAIGYNRVWFNMIRLHRHLSPQIAKALKREGIADPIWYEILLRVEEAGEAGQQMSKLEDLLFVPQYALSRHVARLEKAGLIRREYVADGRRKQILFLTDKAAGLQERVWPIYHHAIQDTLADRCTPQEAYRMARLMVGLFPQDQ